MSALNLKMKILRFYYKLPPLRGGMEKHIFQLTKFQNQSDEVIIFFNQGDVIGHEDIKIVPWVRLDKIKPLFVGIFLFYFCTIFSLIKNKKNVDVIHIHGDWSSLFFVTILKKITKAKKVVYTNHGLVTNSFQHRILLPIMLRNVDLIFTTGNESAEAIRPLLLKKEVIVQPSGINSIFFEPNEKRKRNELFTIITVANLLSVKNLDLIIDIANDIPYVNFKIIGEGPERRKLLQKIDFYGLTNVELCGYKDAYEIKGSYESADCFLMTSFAEGTPTSVLEALAVGLPIISSNAGGIGKIIINEINGLIINDFDKYKFVKSVERIINDADLRDKMKESNKLLALKYRWENVAENITFLMKQCLHKKEG